MLRSLLISSFICFLHLTTYAQQDSVDVMLMEVKDTIRVYDESLLTADTVKVTSLTAKDSTAKATAFLLLDYGKLAMSLSPVETKYELGVGYVFKNGISLIIEAGLAEIVPRNGYQNTDYKAEGIYIRPGISMRMRNTSKNSIFLGAKYGMADFQDEFSLTLTSSIDEPPTVPFDDYSLSIPARENLSAQWAELSFMTEQHFNKVISMGIHLRLRILIDYSQFDPIDVFSIPGYGRSVDKTTPVANLYIKFRIP